jgi:hypothetical protein
MSEQNQALLRIFLKRFSQKPHLKNELKVGVLVASKICFLSQRRFAAAEMVHPQNFWQNKNVIFSNRFLELVK